MSHWFDIGKQAEKAKELESTDKEGLRAWLETLTEDEKAELKAALREQPKVKRALKTAK